MSECTSICPETTQQKLESQRVYLSRKTMNLYVTFWGVDLGVASTLLFSRKLSKLWLSFFLCNYVIYRRTLWQSMDRFHFLWWNPIFGKNTKAIVHKKIRKWNWTAKCWDVHLYVLKLQWKIESHSVFGFPDNYIIIYMYIVYIYFYSYPLP